MEPGDAYELKQRRTFAKTTASHYRLASMDKFKDDWKSDLEN